MSFLPGLAQGLKTLALGLGSGLGLGLGLGLEQFVERRSGDRTRVDGVCDFEKVPPDQLCPSAK